MGQATAKLMVALSAGNVPNLNESDLVMLGKLERSPGKSDNWVEKAGKLPAYIERVADSIHRKRGLPISNAIAIAIDQIKEWASGRGDVNPDTRAKAAAAVAQWEKLKAKNKAQRAKVGD